MVEETLDVTEGLRIGRSSWVVQVGPGSLLEGGERVSASSPALTGSQAQPVREV